MVGDGDGWGMTGGEVYDGRMANLWVLALGVANQRGGEGMTEEEDEEGRGEWGGIGKVWRRVEGRREKLEGGEGEGGTACLAN